MAVSSSSLHWFCWVNTFSICFSCASARDRLYSWYMCSWWTCLQRDWQAGCFIGKERTATQTQTERRLALPLHRQKDIRPDSSRRPEPGHWCPALCLVADLPEPWLCTPQRATAPSSQCPASQTAQRSRPGRWPGSGWARWTRAARRKHASRPWPRRIRSAWSDTLGSYTGVCRRRETWPRLRKAQGYFHKGDQHKSI